MAQFRKLVSVFAILALTGLIFAESAEKNKGSDVVKETKKELKLEELFPEKSVFGTSVSSPAFSYDGRYGAWLYRPYDERRHGNDLYLYDTQNGELIRVTMASVMAEFQESARKVVEDRIAKVKKAAKGDKKEEPAKVETGKEQTKDEDKIQIEKKDEKVKKNKKNQKQKVKKEKQDKKQKERNNKQKKVKKTDAVAPSDFEDTVADDQQADKKAAQKDQRQSDKKVRKKEKDTIKENNDKTQEKEAGKEEVKTDDLEARKLRGDWVDDKDADAKDAPRYGGVNAFEFSPTENALLLVSGGDVYRYQIEGGKIERLTQTREGERNVSWLPDGKGISYLLGSVLMKVDLETGRQQQIDPKFSNGEEMDGYEISPDGKRVAFMTGKEVKAGKSSSVEIANYRGRLMKSNEVNRQVSDDELGEYERRVYLYRIDETGTEKDELTEVFMTKTHYPSDILRGLAWSGDSQQIVFMDYHEDTRLVRFFEAIFETTKEVETKEEAKDNNEDPAEKKEEKAKPDKARQIYEFLHNGGPNTPDMMDLYYLADNQTIVYLSEQTGFRHLNKLDPLYESFTPLTEGPFEVYPIEISKDRKWIFVSATKEHPSRLDIYKVATDSGKMTRLTRDRGVHSSAAVSPDGTRVLTNLVSYARLQELIYLDTKKDTDKTLTDSHPDEAREFIKPQPTFFDYPNRHGHTIYGQTFLPDDWSKDDQRPLLIYFYGGPLGTRKQVVEGNYYGSAYAFPYYMAKKHGYIACTIDPRGNSGYAGVFEKANFGQVGQPQVEDLVDGVKYLVEKYGADPKRVAIHGWSFGGFQTQMCMYTEPDVFAAGIAGAGPTEWENYNSWYTARTIGISDPGKATLKEFSLLPLAKNLKGKLLLVHGMEDSNVLYQDTVNVYRELLKAGKETLVDLFLDPTGGHGLGGDVKTLSRYRKYEDFLIKAIGSGPTKKEGLLNTLFKKSEKTEK